MDNYLVDIHLALKAFGEIGIWYLEMKPIDGVMIFTYFGEKCETSHRLVAIISRYTQAFGMIRIWNLEMKPTDGTMIFRYLGERCETSNSLVAIIPCSYALGVHY